MVSIRQLVPDDFSQIMEIFTKTFPRTDDVDFANAWRTKECNYSLGLYHKATLVGFAITCLEAVALVSKATPSAKQCFAFAAAEAGCIDEVFSVKEASRPAPAARLWFIAVSPDHRSAGAGTQLLTAVMDAIKAANMRLILTPDNNPRVVSWYERHGFKIIEKYPFINKDIPTCLMEWQVQEGGGPDSPVSTVSLSAEQSIESGRSSFDSIESLEI